MDTYKSFRWISVYARLPEPDPGRDYGAWMESREVLVVTESGNIHIARNWTPVDDDGSHGWVLQGRDGYRLDGVIYWAPLPSLTFG